MAPAKYNNRKIWLGTLLLLTVLAAIWPTTEREGIVPASRESGSARTHHAAPTMGEMAALPLAPKTKTGEPATVNDLFPAQTWNTPPPPATKQEPVAPPMPFTFGGRYTEGNDTMIFLVEGNQIYRVRQGDTVKETYRVDKIEAASISLTYLPLGTAQILPTGDLLP